MLNADNGIKQFPLTFFNDIKCLKKKTKVKLKFIKLVIWYYLEFEVYNQKLTIALIAHFFQTSVTF